MRHLCACLVLAALVPSHASAEGDAPPSPFARYAEDPAAQKTNRAFAAALLRQQHRPCAAGTTDEDRITGEPQITHGVDPAFDAAGAPRNGWWTVKVSAILCGEPDQINLQARVDEAGHLDRLGLVAGTTLVKPDRQSAVLADVLDAAAGQMPDGCRTADVITTRGPDERPRAAWNEEWTVSACGRSIPVAVTIPGPTGAIKTALLEDEPADITVVRPAGARAPYPARIAAYAPSAPRPTLSRTVAAPRVTVPVTQTRTVWRTTVVYRTVIVRRVVHHHHHAAGR